MAIRFAPKDAPPCKPSNPAKKKKAALKALSEPKDTKVTVTIKFDRDVLDAFKKDGMGYQTRINAALRDWLGI